MTVTDQHPRPGVDYPRNSHELLAWFPDNAACLRYLERLRWGQGFRCWFCGVVDGGWWQMRDGLRRCASGRSETSVTAGTIFAGTHTPLVSWFAAIWYAVNQKQGVSAPGLQRVFGLGSYETARAWLHKLRRAMVLPGRELLSGAVEIDETYVRARHTSVDGRSPGHKAIVVIAVEGDQAPERVRMRRVPNVKQDTLTEFVLDNVARGSGVRTDAWTGYDDVGRYRFSHVVSNMSATGDPAHVVLPHVHLLASLVKRWVLGTHQGGISHAQLDYHLDEFTFRFNRRSARHRGLLFYRLLEVRWPWIPGRTGSSSANRPSDQSPRGIGGANWIPSCAEREPQSSLPARLGAIGAAGCAFSGQTRCMGCVAEMRVLAWKRVSAPTRPSSRTFERSLLLSQNRAVGRDRCS